jgi:hypothetical protein
LDVSVSNLVLLSAALANSAFAASPHLSITLKHGDAKERQGNFVPGRSCRFGRKIIIGGFIELF